MKLLLEMGRGNYFTKLLTLQTGEVIWKENYLDNLASSMNTKPYKKKFVVR